ncbi:hypothetical protein [Methanobrevibacter cuticularis]|nr:hypothetical protein [Methanobrevibacter cuticularis]
MDLRDYTKLGIGAGVLGTILNLGNFVTGLLKDVLNIYALILLVIIGALIIILIHYMNSSDESKDINKVGIGLVIALLLVSGICFGFTLVNNDLQSNPSGPISGSDEGNNNNSVINTTDSKENYPSDYKIVIDYDGPYTSGYGTEFTNDDFTTSGRKQIDVGQTSHIDVGAKKSDGSNEQLTLSILKGDKVVETKSTTDPYGEVIINFKE